VRSAIAELGDVASCAVSLEEKRATVVVGQPETEQRIVEAVEKLDFTISRRDKTRDADPSSQEVEGGDAASTGG